MQTAIQLYTLRHLDESLLATLDRVGETAFDGVEFATRRDDEPPEEITARLAEHDLEAVSAHVGIEALEDDLETEIEAAHALGYEHVVVPWLDPEHFATVEAVEDAAARLSAIADDLASEGIQLHYHNHDQEFTETDQGQAFHVLAEAAPELQFQVDAGWVMAAGVDPADLVHQYADRISMVHVKDIVAGTSASEDLDATSVPALGDGDLDVESVVEAARAADVEWLVYENDEPADPADALANGDAVLSKHV